MKAVHRTKTAVIVALALICLSLTVLWPGWSDELKAASGYNYHNVRGVFREKDLFLSVLSNPKVIDFDLGKSGTYVNGTLSGREFSSQGVTIVQEDGHRLNLVNPGGIPIVEEAGDPLNGVFTIIDCAENFVSSDPYAISSSYEGPSTCERYECSMRFCRNLSDNIRFDFSPKVKAAGVFIGSNDPSSHPYQLDLGIKVRFLDSAGKVIYSESFYPNGKIFIGIVSSVPISALRVIQGPIDDRGITFDDLIFEK
ncbi:MAG: hypothetical protein RBS57_14265 [Desulforhabdus sp.]|jgi:hypothetical protein|nr:hypothetical protein [Desulforhabdus sp.]